jgi:type II secretory pathway component GspD/PulD (secretin)
MPQHGQTRCQFAGWSKAGARLSPFVASVLIVASVLTTALLWTSPPLAAAQATVQATAQATTTAAAANRPTRPAKPLSGRHLRKADDAYIAGARALARGNVAKAEKQFRKALQLAPNNRDYAVAVAIAREHHVTQLVQAASRAQQTGQAQKATQLIQQASHLDPANDLVRQHLSALLQPAAHSAVVVRQGVANPEFAGAIELQPDTALHSFHFRGNVQAVIQQVLQAYGIRAAFDSTVLPQSIRMDIDQATYAQASAATEMATKTFFVPLGQHSVLAVRDSAENRKKYERQLFETFYLSGQSPEDIKEFGNLIRHVFDTKQITVQTESSSISVRAPQPVLDAIDATLSNMLDDSGELLLNVSIYEMDRTHTLDYGLQLPQQTTVFNVPTELNSIIAANQSLVDQAITSGLVQAGNLEEIAALLIAAGVGGSSILSQPFALFGNGLTLTGLSFGAATLNLGMNSSNTRMLDKVQLRLSDHQEGTVRSGTRYPIITTSYTGITTSSSSSALSGLSAAEQALLGLSGAGSASLANEGNFPSVQYEDLGLTLKGKPSIQRSGSVSLHLEMKIESLAGASLNSVPVLNDRQFTGDITVPAGSSAVLVSSLSKQESTAVSGLPGLDELPGFQTTASQTHENDTQELVIILTPHIIRNRQQDPNGPMLLLPRNVLPGS